MCSFIQLPLHVQAYLVARTNFVKAEYVSPEFDLASSMVFVSSQKALLAYEGQGVLSDTELLYSAILHIGNFALALGALPEPVKPYNAPVTLSDNRGLTLGVCVFGDMRRVYHSGLSHIQSYSITYRGREYYGECVRYIAESGYYVCDCTIMIKDAIGRVRSAQGTRSGVLASLIVDAFKANVRAYAESL